MSPSFLPPTPAPSTDVSGKSDARPTHLEGAFTLPPAAMSSGRSGSSGISSASSKWSDSSYGPISPSSLAATSRDGPPAIHKRPSIIQPTIIKDEYSLPSPPTLSRKIIQMKPRSQKAQRVERNRRTTQAASGSTTLPATMAGTERKHTNGTTAAGRKVMRKTAHNLVERRRRSKTNEEFGVLKDVIPACVGQEMHKLAILQVNGFLQALFYLRRNIDTEPQLHRPALSTYATSNNASQTSKPPTSSAFHPLHAAPVKQPTTQTPPPPCTTETQTKTETPSSTHQSPRPTSPHPPRPPQQRLQPCYPRIIPQLSPPPPSRPFNGNTPKLASRRSQPSF